jgi:hypothetical protein
VISNHGASTDEDVVRRPHGRLVHERPERHVHPRTVADDREEERAACGAARVVQVLLADDQQRVAALDELQVLPLTPAKA